MERRKDGGYIIRKTKDERIIRKKKDGSYIIINFVTLGLTN